MKFLNKERLNLLIALCAILISTASFYATYQQAKAANLQVKVMTMPIVEFSHGNFDIKEKKPLISFTLKNAGSGPAILKSIQFNYKNILYSNHTDFLKGCCKKDYNELMKNIASAKREERNISFDSGGIVSSPTENTIIPAKSDFEFLRVYKGDLSIDLWEKIDQERFNLSLIACFCSPLGDCYQSNSEHISVEVNSCPTG
ncbi:hypothetical protein [Microbulbifer spongiae]|uniref:Uncharacterized protein n=1 Tax=Microbulbifer spongiae TaxID=2944933 RepID=A0ABY9EA56_9GAMM|nr:hypothetical protein [Microbulbifer sp. MI-G]WKD49345.1 hypothetical protein M8T91_15790 [Microbulbifer sp. MI-G]